MALRFQPGDLVRGYATLNGWRLAPRAILVEGEHDQRYFALADRLYAESNNLRLVSSSLSVFPTGIGDEGGAYGLQRHFHPLRALMDKDITAEGRKVFHAIALFDNDPAGKRGFAALTGQHLNYRQWRDVFLLQRVLPRETRDANSVAKLVETKNSEWRGLDCEIEDLVSPSFTEVFLAENPGAVTGPSKRIGGEIHTLFTPAGKARFVQFVETYARLADIERILELLKSLRYYVGLPPDGDSTCG